MRLCDGAVMDMDGIKLLQTMGNVVYYGKVIRGLGNGRKFGFPTANIQLSEKSDIAKGVYAVGVYVDGKRHEGMLYVGTRPTLSLSELTYEIHLLDFQGDLYDKDLFFVIEKQVREEQHFANVEALIEQLQHDREVVRKILE